MAQRHRVMCLFGTRPEAIKMAPVIQRLQQVPDIEPIVVVTGQHREMLDQVLDVFDIKPDVDLDLMRHGQSLAALTERTMRAVTGVLESRRPDLLVVQGDTTSAFVGGLAAFYRHVPVAHVEAGLRTFNPDDPFPEEINRRLLSVLSTLHFAPTEGARRNLIAEGIARSRIIVTGNTVVDAVQAVGRSQRLGTLPPVPGVGSRSRLIRVTLHRRESWGEPMADACRGLRRVLDEFPDVRLLVPLHRNPIVREVVRGVLGDQPRAHLVEPLDYLSFVKAMSQSFCVATDSGGIQEEAPALGKPVLVLRETTERPEAIEAGVARLVGTRADDVFDALATLLSDRAAYEAMARAVSPFGDGHAAERIVDHITGWWSTADAHSSTLVA